MGVIASWGTKKFEVNPKKIYPFRDFSTGFKLKTDANADTSGTSPTNTRGRELEQIKCSTYLLASAGVDVRGEFDSWRKLLGEAHPFFIGGVSFGAGNFQLESVDISEAQLDTNGNFLAAALSFTFTEYIPASTSATAKATTKSSKSSGKNATKSMTETIAEKKKEAMNATASTDDKKKKSPY